MLSRAKGLLPARVSHGRPVTGRRFNFVFTKPRVDVFGRPYGIQDGEKSASSQNATTEPLLFRRVRVDESPAEESSDTQTRSENKEQTEETESKRRYTTKYLGPAKAPSNQKATSDPKRTTRRTTIPGARPRPIHGRVAFGVVTTSHPADTSIDQFIKEMRPLRQAKIPGHHENPTLLVILLTPGLARYALDSNVPGALYKRLGILAKPGVKVEATSAIVDRLPSELDKPEGSEGIAYMLFRNPPMGKPEDRTVFQQSAQKPGSLTFRMPRYSPKTTSPVSDHEVQLPLSQTVFTTGMVSTLIHRTFAVDVHGGPLKILEEQRLESQTLQLPALPASFGVNSITMPLVPLTRFRTINYVMGNIIRKLSSKPVDILKASTKGTIHQTKGSEVAEDSMPASEELEKSVSRYFEELDLQPETVSVWALVMPRPTDVPLVTGSLRGFGLKELLCVSDETITRAWHPESQAAKCMAKGLSNALRLLIPRGARLIKVLSGGGGWGKKAGLLSLDPDVQYSTRELRQDEGWKFDFDGVDDGSAAATEAQKNQALGQIVKEGESIMFLLAPKPEHVTENKGQAHHVVSRTRLKELPKTLDWTFGAIPSSIDMIPQDVASDPNAAEIRHYPGRFGMLSEGGMSVTVNQTQGTVGQTKLDVPLGTFVIQHFGTDYFRLQSAAEWAEVSASSSAQNVGTDYFRLQSAAERAEVSGSSSVASQASEAQDTHDTMHAEESAELEQIEYSSDNTELANLFRSFAEHDETEDAQPTAADLENKSSDSLTPR